MRALICIPLHIISSHWSYKAYGTWSDSDCLMNEYVQQFAYWYCRYWNIWTSKDCDCLNVCIASMMILQVLIYLKLEQLWLSIFKWMNECVRLCECWHYRYWGIWIYQQKDIEVLGVRIRHQDLHVLLQGRYGMHCHTRKLLTMQRKLLQDLFCPLLHLMAWQSQGRSSKVWLQILSIFE